MNGFNIRYWPTKAQRLLGFGALTSVVAIHSKKTRLPANAIESWYNSAYEWMKGISCQPKTLSLVGVKGFKDAVGYDFARADFKLRKRGFADLPQVSLTDASPPGPSYWKPWESVILLNSLNRGGGAQSCLVWGWEHDKREFSKEIILRLVDMAKNWVTIDYAFAFQDYTKGYPPTTKALLNSFMKVEGRKLTGYSNKELVEVMESGFHPIDLLREIYPFQILAPVHLSYRIGSQTLHEWIVSSGAHGRLEAFSENRWFWEIPDEQLQTVRNSLVENNLLTQYLPDSRRIIADYANPLILQKK